MLRGKLAGSSAPLCFVSLSISSFWNGPYGRNGGQRETNPGRDSAACRPSHVSTPPPAQPRFVSVDSAGRIRNGFGESFVTRAVTAAPKAARYAAGAAGRKHARKHAGAGVGAGEPGGNGSKQCPRRGRAVNRLGNGRAPGGAPGGLRMGFGWSSQWLRRGPLESARHPPQSGPVLHGPQPWAATRALLKALPVPLAPCIAGCTLQHRGIRGISARTRVRASGRRGAAGPQ